MAAQKHTLDPESHPKLPNSTHRILKPVTQVGPKPPTISSKVAVWSLAVPENGFKA